MMRDLLSIERVIPSLRVANKRQALRNLAAHAANNPPMCAEIVVRAVLEGAELPAFGPATGVSLPHAFIPGLVSPHLTFAKLDPAVDFGAADGSKTDLVALLLSPMDNAGGHLRALACVARTLRNTSTRKLLRGADTRDSIYAILCGYDASSQEPATSDRSWLRKSTSKKAAAIPQNARGPL